MSIYYILYGFKTASGKISLQETLGIPAKDAKEALEKFKKFTTPFVMANLKYLEVKVLETLEYGRTEQRVRSYDQVIATEFLVENSL